MKTVKNILLEQVIPLSNTPPDGYEDTKLSNDEQPNKGKSPRFAYWTRLKCKIVKHDDGLAYRRCKVSQEETEALKKYEGTYKKEMPGLMPSLKAVFSVKNGFLNLNYATIFNFELNKIGRTHV